MPTYPDTTALAAKAWLFGQMQTGLTAVDPTNYTFGVTYADPSKTISGTDDQVWMGAIVSGVTSRFAFVGNMAQSALQEQYDLIVNFSCFRPGDNADVAEAAAYAYAKQVRTIARTDPTFGGILTTSYPFQFSSDVDWDDQEAANGRIGTHTLSVHCFSPI